MMMVIIIIRTTTTIMMMMMIIVVMIVIVVVLIVIIISAFKGANRDFLYNLLTAPRTVSNTFAQVARAQLCANQLHRALITRKKSCCAIFVYGRQSTQLVWCGVVLCSVVWCGVVWCRTVTAEQVRPWNAL